MLRRYRPSAADKEKLEDFTADLNAAGASVYQRAGADGASSGALGGNGNGASAGSSAADVIEAEFTESK